MITEHNASNHINTGGLHLSVFVFLFIHVPHPPSHLSCFLSIIFLHWFNFLLPLLHRPPGLTGSPVISDISLIRLSPHGAPGSGESPFSHPHPYVSPHMEHYLRSVHGSPTLSMISAARGLSPAEGKIYPK